MLKTLAPRVGYYAGGLQHFSLCLSMKRLSGTTPQTSVPVMAISPCLSKEWQVQATEPSGAPQPFRALRSPMCIPVTEPCRVPRESLSSTGRGKSGSQAPQDGLFLDRQGEKGLASARHVPMIAVSSTGRGERESQAHGHIQMIAFSSTGKGKKFLHPPCREQLRPN